MRLLAFAVAVSAGVGFAQSAPPAQHTDLGQQLAAGKLRVVNRQATPTAGRPGAVHLSARADVGLAWVAGTNFSEGTIEIDTRGRDVLQQSFLGIAFHGKDDKTYESVYLRPFNFRATDPARHDHALQYMTVPEFDWPRLREEFPEEFENPVNASLVPTEWVTLRVVVSGQRVQIFAGGDKTPTLEVRKLGTLTGGMIGLWVGNNSDG